MGASMRRAAMPAWSLLVLGVLFVGPVVMFESVFGGGQGAIAAGVGVLVGLLVSWAASKWRWDLLSIVASVVAAHFLFGGAAALRETTRWGVVPTSRTLQTLVIGAVEAWKDLLTLTPPAASYVGPAMVPWMACLVCSVAAGVVTVRYGRPMWGSVALILCGVIAIVWGPTGHTPNLALVIVWWVALIAWWSWASAIGRARSGTDIVIGMSSSTTSASTTMGGSSRQVVHVWWRVGMGALMVGVMVAAAIPAASLLGPTASDRIVGRDVVEPPVDAREYPSPLSSYRHYNKDLEDSSLIHVSNLPKEARVRLGAMDVYDGTTFGMSVANTDGTAGYRRVGSTIPGRSADDAELETNVSTSQLLGPWVPTIGQVHVLRFDEGDPNAAAQQKGLNYDLWAETALTTGPAGEMGYTMSLSMPREHADSEYASVEATRYAGGDTNVPKDVDTLAAEHTTTARSDLEKARAIENFLHTDGYYSNDDTINSRPGSSQDRIQRMIGADMLVGDDEQYATLMALMLHSQGINARVVMGAYREGTSGNVDLTGADMHAWVEVEFPGVGWATFDPTPPRDQQPTTQVNKPKSVPKPQVLQPPEPPEQPVELPPATRDQATDPHDPNGLHIPWMAIGTVSLSLLILLGPIVLVLLAKSRRRKSRRKAAAAEAVRGSWDELVDTAIDSGLVVEPHLTRQEVAWALASQWAPETPEGGEAPSRKSRKSGKRSAADVRVPGWSLFSGAVPRVVTVARRADVADFALTGARSQDAEQAWEDVDELRREWASSVSVFARVRHALSLKSLRWRRRASRQAAAASGAKRRSLMGRMGRRKGKR
ncbi:transglutaminase-like domain-containing protein [Pauljensenia sp. UMB3104]|uniref:transglutaminase-like domain-containing protein n=1 Tax=Pauljensenia sp. UMB3104 TaxID=3046331 RepID=UPI0027B8DAB6|nr:transglutaminase-like domain-containing protein [Pauljensenia sp. UMB3104]